MPCSSSSEGEAAAASWAVPRTPVIASRSSAAPVLRARLENRDIVFIRQNLPPNCYRRITSMSVVCHLPLGLTRRGGVTGHCPRRADILSALDGTQPLSGSYVHWTPKADR